jgi:hypothetical protein
MPRIVKYNGYDDYYKTYNNLKKDWHRLSIKPTNGMRYCTKPGEYIVIYKSWGYGNLARHSYFPLNLWLSGLISRRIFSWKHDYGPWLFNYQIEELND